MIMYQTRGSAGQSSHHSRNVHWKCSPKNHLLFPYLHSSVINPIEFTVPPYIRKDRTLGPLSSSPKSSQSWGTTEQTAAARAALGAAKTHKVKQQLLGEYWCLQQDGTDLGCVAVSLPLRVLGLGTNQHTLHQPSSATVIWYSPGTGALWTQLKKGPRASVWPGFLRLHS